MANAARTPDVWKRLRRASLPAFVGARRERIEAIARAAGLAVEAETDIPAELEDWMSRQVDHGADSGEQALLRIVADPRYQVILETRSLRVVTRLSANLFWRAWAACPP